MRKSIRGYQCENCNFPYAKWAGQCSECKSWGTIEERTAPNTNTKLNLREGKIVELVGLKGSKNPLDRQKTGLKEFDRVLGGGLVKASTILVGGDPGIGKSTILLQVASSMANMGAKIIYVSGEESTDQLRMRAKRLGQENSPVEIAAETNLTDILTTIESEKPDLIIVDSIQTVYSEHLDNAPGSISQVRSSVMELTSFAKSYGVAAILVGHVTKEGQIAGPRLVEHMVDTVLYFEGEKSIHYRILRSVKNRFGASDEIGVFEMTGLGLQQVENPSALFLGERNSNSAGSVVLAAIEGTRPVLVEIQALVATSSLATARRAAVGWEPARLAMVMAILESRCGKSFIGKDVYLNVAGGMKISEPAADLAVAAALMSAVEEIELAVDTIVFGELSLSGAIRQVTQTDSRLKEAKKLGFSSIVLPSGSKFVSSEGMKVIECKTISEFLEKNRITKSPAESS
ncbi:MAG: DNA repair protein RadA [Pseudomonadota bacterium]|nr:DNA repair protein RadA [Pseudomonadota bacterium]